MNSRPQRRNVVLAPQVQDGLLRLIDHQCGEALLVIRLRIVDALGHESGRIINAVLQVDGQVISGQTQTFFVASAGGEY